MFKKSFSISLLCLFVLGTTVPAFATYYAPKSGYTTTTQIVDSKQLFVYHQFLETDFTLWLSLLYRAQANENFSNWIKTAQISPQGQVLTTDLMIGKRLFRVGEIISIEDIVAETPHNFKESQLIDLLVKAKILNEKGYMVDVSGNRNNSYEPIDFSKVEPKLDTLILPIDSPKSNGALTHELFNLLTIKHREIEVTSQDTTRYQSRNDNLFSGLFESIGGNILAGIFSPDKTKVTRSELAYIPNTNIQDLYPLPVGFSPYSGFGNKPGLWCINGNSSLLTTQIESENHSDVQFIDAKINLSWLIHPSAYYSPLFAFTQIEGEYEEIKTRTATTRYFSVTLPYLSGGIIHRNNRTNFGFGLVYAQSTERKNLGMKVAIETDYAFTPWFGITLNGNYLFQPNFGSQNIWDQAKLETALVFTPLAHLSASAGYQWLASSTDTNTEGYIFGLRYEVQP